MLAQPLPDPLSNRTIRRLVPRVLVAILAAQAVAPAWMTYFGFPRKWGDNVTLLK